MSILVWLAILGGLALLGIILACDRWVSARTENLHYSRIQDLPEHEVAVVLGCSEKLANGRSNLYFKYRVEAAASVYRSGKCKTIIVSGDNGRSDYNEPARMKEALTGLGIPSERIQPDYAGFRTLDSVLRANAVFDQDRFTIVSQSFHNERAIYIARQHGLEAVGFDARDVAKANGFKTRLREGLARVKTILDVHLFDTKPKSLGPKIALNR